MSAQEERVLKLMDIASRITAGYLSAHSELNVTDIETTYCSVMDFVVECYIGMVEGTKKELPGGIVGRKPR